MLFSYSFATGNCEKGQALGGGRKQAIIDNALDPFVIRADPEM